jgi:hypothetical protein
MWRELHKGRFFYMPKRTRQISVFGDIAEIPLTKGHVAIIDVHDIHLVIARNWHAHVQNHTVYAKRGANKGGKYVGVYLHSALLGPAPDGMRIDHRDGNGLNNRRSNLRYATDSQNSSNRRFAQKSTSGVKGVTWHKASAAWQSQIKVRGKGIYLGLFRCRTAAHLAYAKASQALHGQFGRLA